MKVYENPLINNKKLRQLYVAMVGARVLDKYAARRRGKENKAGRLVSTRGEEACRVSTAIELIDGDLVSDTQAGVVMDFVAGETVASLLRRMSVPSFEVRRRKAKSPRAKGAAQMPWVEDAGERLRIAVGAALAFKTLQHPNLVMVYVRSGEVAEGDWRRMLALASKFELPIIFVVLPRAGGRRRRKAANISAIAKSRRVPCIPVDANDAVALYRAAQESIGRARGEGGAVILECIVPRMEEQHRADREDPIVQLEKFMLGRRVCSKAWLSRVGDSFRKRIDAAR
jgi:TPP-dependent pyruvate/acetoin dehydrogenase alpha subunit